MFVAGNNYPNQSLSIAQTAPAFITQGELSIAPSFIVRKTEIVFDRASSAIASPIDSQIQLQLSPEIATVTEVFINGQSYNYTYNSTNQTLTIAGVTTESVVYWAGISTVPPPGIGLINCVHEYPGAIISEWNVERFSLSKQVEEPPTASIEFSACAELESLVRLRFKPGSERINLFGIPFRVSQLQITRKGSFVYPNYNISVSVSLEWYYSESFEDSPLNEPPKKETDKPGKTDIVTTVVGRQQGQFDVKGSAHVSILSEKTEVDGAAYSTVGEALKDGAYQNGCFLFYSGESVVARKWGQTATHFISPGEIDSENLQFTLSLSSIKEEEEEEEEEEEAGASPERDEEEIVETERVEYENADSDDDLSRAFYQFSDAARSPTICFDNGGPTKKKRTIKERGGVMLETREETWGYTFISQQVHAFYPDKDPVEYEYTGTGTEGWQKVSETKTTNYFDDLGYLVKTETTGYKLARFKQESDSLETCGLWFEVLEYGYDTEDGQRSLQEIENYRFNQKFPLYDVTTYQLESMVSHYRDIVRSSDPSWIEPKFCSLMRRSQVDRILQENPNTDEGTVHPPIIQIQELIEETRTIITNVKCTPERFVVKQYSNGSEGTGGRNRIAIASSVENLGRPSTHTTVPIKRIYWQDLIVLPNSEKDEKTKKEEEKKRQAAIKKTQDAIAQSKQETLSFSMLYRSNLVEGDRVVVDNKTWVILSINAEFVCQVGKINCEQFTLNLGIL